jgi:hypothetical protein
VCYTTRPAVGGATGQGGRVRTLGAVVSTEVERCVARPTLNPQRQRRIWGAQRQRRRGHGAWGGAGTLADDEASKYSGVPRTRSSEYASSDSSRLCPQFKPVSRLLGGPADQVQMMNPPSCSRNLHLFGAATAKCCPSLGRNGDRHCHRWLYLASPHAVADHL